MNKTCSIRRGLLALVSPGAAQYKYTVKPDTNTNYPVEPILPPGATSVQKSDDGDYPYYGNAPDELLPYRNIQPYFRYWLTRLPFRGPGKDYPDPPGLKSVKIGLFIAGAYWLEAGVGG